VNKLISGTYPTSAFPTTYEELSTYWYNKGASIFSTNKVGLFTAKFD
jgi:hypothetical protein